MSNEQILDSQFIVGNTPGKPGSIRDDTSITDAETLFAFENSTATINSPSEIAYPLNSPVAPSHLSAKSLSAWLQDIGNDHRRLENDDNRSDDFESYFPEEKPPSFNYQTTGPAVTSSTEMKTELISSTELAIADVDDDPLAMMVQVVDLQESTFDHDRPGLDCSMRTALTCSIRSDLGRSERETRSTRAISIIAEEDKSTNSQDNGDQSTVHASIRKSSRLSLVRAVSARNTRAERVLEELTINKLKILSLGLVGRAKEKSILKDCYHRMCMTNELVFIHGYSGIGKSMLARTLDTETSSLNAVFLEGKHEFTSTGEPYLGLSQVFRKLCNKFHDCPSETREKIANEIKEKMNEEAYMLMNIIPEISVFLESNDALSASFRDGAAFREHERWKYAFRTFTRILGSHCSPIIIMLDDLQWADISSLDIMDYLISDVQNPNPLMIIGCYRSNEVDENSMLYNRIRTLQGKSQKGIFRLTDIKLENCNLHSVNKIIMSMMSMDNPSETWELAEVCFKRTLGNPFFLIEFMRMLHTEGLLGFNIGLMKWIWNVEKIENGTMSAANVADLLQARMKKMPKGVQLLLQYAACLGASFSAQILEHIWSQHACARLVRGATDNFEDMLETIQKERFVEPCELRWVPDVEPSGLDELRWVHNKVQEAALSLSDLVTPEFQSELGMFLFRGLGKAQLEQKLFDVVDLVNKGNDTDRFDVALMNFRAATKARKMAALSSAAKYASFGIKQLVADKWTLHRGLTLQLYSLGAEMEYALGHIDKAEEYIEIVLARKEYSPLEKFPLKKMKAQILAVAHLRWDEATDYCLEVLNDLGFKFVWNRKLNPVQMVVAARKTAKRLKKVDVEYINCLDFIEEKNMLAVVDMLHLMKHVTYNANNLPLCFICICKVIELTLDNGISRCSGNCFSGIGGALMFLFKDHAAALHACNLAFALQKRSGRRFIADTIVTTWSFVYSHIKPLHEGLNLLTAGYSQGLRDGDPLNATSCMAHRFVFLPYMMGRSLDSVIKEFPKIAPQMEESGIKENVLTLRIWWQMMVNLTLSPSDEASKTVEGEHFRQSEEKAESNMYVGNVNFVIGELLLFFGDYEGRAERLLGEEKGKTYSELVVGYTPHTIETFHRGIVWFEMAQKTGKRAYKSRAIKIKKEISKWAEMGNPNAKDYDLLLSAEQCVLNKKYKKAEEYYKKAIVHAARIGHLAHAALYNERFGKYLLDVHWNVDECRYHMEEAIRFYTGWGAIGKAEQLRQMYF